MVAQLWAVQVHMTALDYEFLMVSFLILGKTKTCGCLLEVSDIDTYNEEP